MKYKAPFSLFSFTILILLGWNSSSAHANQSQAEAVVDQSPVVVGRFPIKEAKPADYIGLIELPEGFQIDVFSDQVPGARSMTLAKNGTVFVGTRGRNGDPERRGDVYAVRDTDQDMVADEVITVARDLFMPNGVAMRGDALFVAEPNRVLRYDNIEAKLAEPPKPVVINESFPSDIHHGWKYIAFGPDDRLYLPVGAPCNICESSDEYAVINSIAADGSDKRIEAFGIRNTVGFDWHPVTKELWFTDNGRDLWSDDMPPEELNRVSQRGQHFGYPYEYGKGHRDNVFEAPDIDFEDAALELPPHTAPLGMKFYTGDMFPVEYKNAALIPHHGSWNRAEPAGYYISLVKVEGGIAQDMTIFAQGWLQGKVNWGRPTDILQMPDGSILVSDDQAGAIYRISYAAQANAQ